MATVEGGVVDVDPETGEVTIGVPTGMQETVTITREVSCTDGSTPTNVTLVVGDNSFPMTSDGDNQYSVTLTTPDDLPDIGTSFALSVTYDCDGEASEVPIGELTLYDPSGIITDRATGEPIEDAMVNLYRLPDALPDKDGQAGSGNCRTTVTRPAGFDGPVGAWSGLSAAEIDAGVWLNSELATINDTQVISPTINPQVTGDNGRYGWDVAAGCWYVVVEAQGYDTIVSPVVGVPPEVTDLNISLTRSSQKLYLPLISRD